MKNLVFTKILCTEVHVLIQLLVERYYVQIELF